MLTKTPRFLLALFSFIAGTAVFDILAESNPGSIGRVLVNLVISTGVTLAVFYAGERILMSYSWPMNMIRRVGSFFTRLFDKPDIDVKQPDAEAEARENAIEYERLQNNVGRGGG